MASPERRAAHTAEERRAAFAQGMAALRGGRFLEAHETFEAIWLTTAAVDPARLLLHGLAQAAAALHNGTVLGRPTAAARTLAKASARFARCDGDAAAEVDVELAALATSLEHWTAYFLGGATGPIPPMPLETRR